MSEIADQQRLMYDTWLKEQKEEQLHALMESLSPLLKREVERYSRYPVAPNVLWTQANLLAKKAIESYDPNKGAALSTHVVHGLKPLHRYVTENANVKYVPEAVRRHYGTVEEAQRRLSTSLGRAPTYEEIGADLKMPAQNVERIMFAKAPESNLGETDVGETDITADTWRQAQADRLAYLRAELQGNERKAFDMLLGRQGRPPISNKGEVADKLGIPVEDVYGMARQWTRRLSD